MPTSPPRSSPAARSKWSAFRAFPVLGQVGIGLGIVVAALLGAGAVGALAGPTAASTPPVSLAAAATSSVATVPATSTTATLATTTTTTTEVATSTTAIATVPVSTVVAAVAPATASPTVTDAVVPLTAVIVDGDTIDVSDGSTVRLIGIDTPERGQCGYDEASAVLAQFVAGQTVTLVPGARDNVDRYGRLLRYVEVNGVDLDLKMIESGRAIARYDGRDGYGVHPRQDAYVQADASSPSANVCATIATAPVTSTAKAPASAPPAATVYYNNCAAVRAAGAAPIRAGDPGWQTKFDRDGDGVGCE